MMLISQIRKLDNLRVSNLPKTRELVNYRNEIQAQAIRLQVWVPQQEVHPAGQWGPTGVSLHHTQ